MDMLSLPLIVVVAVYGALAASITKAIRATLKKHRPAVERWITNAEIVKRLVPCAIAFVLLIASPSSFIGLLGLDLSADPCPVQTRALLAVFAGIFSGWTYHLMRDTLKRGGGIRGWFGVGGKYGGEDPHRE